MGRNTDTVTELYKEISEKEQELTQLKELAERIGNSQGGCEFGAHEHYIDLRGVVCRHEEIREGYCIHLQKGR